MNPGLSLKVLNVFQTELGFDELVLDIQDLYPVQKMSRSFQTIVHTSEYKVGRSFHDYRILYNFLFE